MSRRRCLALFASAAALPLTAEAATTDSPTWQGTAMGGDVSIRLEGFSAAESAELTKLAVSELDRLEDVFSLYRPSSALSKLNRDGVCSEAPEELIAALKFCRNLYEKSGRAFDPSVQKLWESYEAGKSDLAEVLTLVDFDRVHVSGSDVILPVGMALTLNGIAQGIATDGITALMRKAGARHTLINLGEFRALGPKLDGSAWRVGLRDPSAIWRTSDVVHLRSGALATSAGSGHRFRNGHHLFDPRSGQSAQHFDSVSVVAPTATLADGLSTALYVLPLERARQMVSQYDNVAARFTCADGRIILTDRWKDLVA
ncbi:MAG: FAD:protein FMN transferase [Rhodobiaceae bacterium]|nr:FAD:protein FMN transferase [Rhodobiaceae bacterium]